jgi:excisionase family DNA binding protein
MDKLLTLQEVASTLQLSTKTISRYIERGKIKASKFGNRWRIKSGEVGRLVEEAEGKKKK